MPRTRYIIQEGTLNEDRVEFQVATFLVADVAGYSPLMGAHEEGHFHDKNAPARAD